MDSKRIKLSVAIEAPISVRAVSTPISIQKPLPCYLREHEPEIDARDLEQCGVATAALPFQRTCIAFLNSHKNVALLDEMGLGKTFQVLCAIRTQPPSHRFLSEAVQAGRYRGNTLVVCPKIVQQQWIEQYNKHLAPKQSTHKAIAYTSKTSLLTPLELCSFEIIVITYDFLRSISAKNASLVSIQFWRVVLDEAHCVKNHASKRFEYIDILECTRRVALSGTPMHNTLTDVFPMLRFFRCFKGELTNAFETWRQNVIVPFESNRKTDSFEYVHTLLDPFIIRRLKSSHWHGAPLLNNMPKKSFVTIDVRMTVEETKAYVAIERGCLAKGILLDKDTLGKHETAYEGFRKLHKLRLCCVGSTLKSKQEDVTCSVCENAQPHFLLSCSCQVCPECKPHKQRCRGCDSSVTSAVPVDISTNVYQQQTQSSKFRALETYVQTKSQDDKIIVFSSWVIVLDAFQASCSLGLCARIDGSMTQKERAAQLASFRSTHRVLLMTFGAGSTGIDLTCANHVVFVDPHWSPAIEMQAEDRAYRIGQTKEVHIVHLIQSRNDGTGTIEHVIRGVQRRKQKDMNTLFPV